MKITLRHRPENGSGSGSMRHGRWKTLVGAVFVVFASLENAMAIDQVSISPKMSKKRCADFLKLQKDRAAISRRSLVADDDQSGERRIQNVDIDGDDISDEIIWSPTGSASLVPPDNSTLKIRLSSGGEIDFEAPRFILAKHKGKVYVFADESNANGSRVRTKVFSLRKTGIHLECVLGVGEIRGDSR